MGRVMDNEYLLINQEQYLQFLKDCHKVKAKIEIILPDKKVDSEMLRPGEFGCHCGREICWITQNGEVYPCIFFGDKYSVGNIRKERFIDLWKKSKEMVRFKGNDHCNDCENYKNCRGGCRSRALWQYKDINAIDPYCPLSKNKKYETTISSSNISIH
jgi:radical SAM protein with 4Fe4S-binding SPASM domain